MLERDLGFKILERNGNETEITPRARAYAEDVRRALNMISTSTERLSLNGLSGRLTISAPPGFVSAWLSINLGDFLAQNPEVVLNVISSHNLTDTSNPEADTFITFGVEARAHVFAETLLNVEFSPLCSPAYLSRFKNFNDPSILKSATLLHMADFADWEDWMRQAGLPAEHARRGICYSDMNIVYNAVMAGEGIAIGDTVLWAKDVQSGKLMRPFAQSLHSDSGYFLCTPEENLNNPIVIEFHKWLKTRLEVSGLRHELGA